MSTVHRQAASDATLVLVPGLRDATPEHWQTLLMAQLPGSVGVTPMGREDLGLNRRLDLITDAVASADGPVILVAHSAGCVMVAHWVRRAQEDASTGALLPWVHAALLATPPDFEQAMPAGYPTPELLRTHGWLPVPMDRLPFASLVASSRNDPLASPRRVAVMAAAWGSELEDLGEVGHLNPASGFGAWPHALVLIERLRASAQARSTAWHA